MKRFSLIMMCFALVAMSSCAKMNKIANSNSGAQLTGNQCAVATHALYKTYKSTNKIDLTNTTNVANILTVVTSYNQLKKNKDNSAYRKAFASGAVAAGTGIITTDNVGAFTNALINSSAFNGVTSKNVQTKVQTTAAIINLFKTLK